MKNVFLYSNCPDVILGYVSIDVYTFFFIRTQFIRTSGWDFAQKLRTSSGQAQPQIQEQNNFLMKILYFQAQKCVFNTKFSVFLRRIRRFFKNHV